MLWKNGMDRMDALATFVAILDTGSLAAAGRRLGRSPPAVSRDLAALEDTIGARLIERTTRRLAPTEAGQRLAARARDLLAELDAALQPEADAATLRGTLRVAAPQVFGRLHMTPLVSGFLAEHPALRVGLALSDQYVDLVEAGIDVALRIGALPDSSLVTRRLGMVRRVLVASPAYLDLRGTPVQPGDLSGHAVIFTRGSSAAAEWRFRVAGRDRAVPIVPRLTVNQVDAALFAARAGHGIARPLSYQVADDLDAGRLVRLLAAFEPPPLPVQLALPSARHMAPAVRAFVDFAVARLGSLAVLRDA
jgi:DNA-binding transcriptional LysR family regulator